MPDTPKRYRPHQREYHAEWRAKNADHVREYGREQMRKRRSSKVTGPPKPPKTGPEIRAKRAAYQRKWRLLNKDKVKEQNAKQAAKGHHVAAIRRQRAAKHNHIRNLELLAERPKPQACDVCGGSQGGIVFDHCHRTSNFRGWLCNGCNRALGFVNDDPNRLRMLAAYLERTKDGQGAQFNIPGI